MTLFLSIHRHSQTLKVLWYFRRQRDHVSLIKRAMNRLNSEGTLYFSNNYRGFEMDEEIESIFQVEEITSETIGLILNVIKNPPCMENPASWPRSILIRLGVIITSR